MVFLFLKKIKLKLFKNITIYINKLVLYMTVGVKHFINTDFFVSIVPPYINWKKEVCNYKWIY